MKIPLRVLIIEDSDDDKELLLHEINRGGYEPDYLCIETAEDLNSALDKQSWDIILSDFAMPRFNGLAALQIVRARQVDIPFIIVSGTIGEDIAVTAMKAGAQDYIMKGNLKRLIPAVERELKDAEIRRQRMLSEKALHESEEIFRKAFFFSPDSIAIIRERDGVFISVNKGFTQITGFTEDEILGKTTTDINIWKNPVEEKLYELGLKQSGEVQNLEARFLTKYGEIDGLLSASVIELNDEPHILKIIRDITDKKKNEVDLINAKVQAEQSNRLKDAFMANISHEIRTPLNGILGMTSIIYDSFASQVTKAEEEYFNAITLSSNRITRTIDMILNYSQLQIGNFPTYPKTINLTNLINEQIKKHRVVAVSKSIELVFENNIGPVEITNDEYCITYSISSLIDNALKFTETGSVKLLLYEDGNGNVNLEVKDTGIGISEQYIGSLFNPYSQEDVGYGRSYEGLGLSLSLAQKLLQLNGVGISVSSKKDVGSTFTIHFNTKKTNEIVGSALHTIYSTTGIAEAAQLAEEGKAKILIVEDDAINQLYMKAKLRKFYDVTVASSAAEALDKLKTSVADIILMDISLQGGMNGLELTQLLKADARYSIISIIAVTGHAFKEDRERILAAGCNDYLAKPFHIDELFEKIKLNLGKD